jgi:hypothetical protein
MIKIPGGFGGIRPDRLVIDGQLITNTLVGWVQAGGQFK